MKRQPRPVTPHPSGMQTMSSRLKHFKLTLYSLMILAIISFTTVSKTGSGIRTLVTQYVKDNVINQRIIYGATGTHGSWAMLFNFSKCPYNNCIIKSGESANIDDASIVLFHNEFIRKYPTKVSKNRSKQIWVLYAMESPFSYNRYFRFSQKVNGYFNATMTYRADSDIHVPYGRVIKKPQSLIQEISYAAGKSKGAFAYVSNCNKTSYDRIAVMNELKKYIDVDIYGPCTDNNPCPTRMNYTCEKSLHFQYRFYLSFENSLCMDYITEKFWSRLESDGNFVPVVLGGLTIADYNNIAPPDSFLHVYNFSSTENLGKYLQNLMLDDERYNKYHAWRSYYDVITRRIDQQPSCLLCKMANEMPSMPAIAHLDKWYNNPLLCRRNGRPKSRQKFN